MDEQDRRRLVLYNFESRLPGNSKGRKAINKGMLVGILDNKDRIDYGLLVENLNTDEFLQLPFPYVDNKEILENDILRAVLGNPLVTSLYNIAHAEDRKNPGSVLSEDVPLVGKLKIREYFNTQTEEYVVL